MSDILNFIEEIKKCGPLLKSVETRLKNFLSIDDIKDYIYNIVEKQKNPKHGESTFECWVKKNPKNKDLDLTKLSDLVEGSDYKRLSISSPILGRYTDRTFAKNKVFHTNYNNYLKICVYDPGEGPNKCFNNFEFIRNSKEDKLFLFEEIEGASIAYLGEYKIED